MRRIRLETSESAKRPNNPSSMLLPSSLILLKVWKHNWDNFLVITLNKSNVNQYDTFRDSNFFIVFENPSLSIRIWKKLSKCWSEYQTKGKYAKKFLSYIVNNCQSSFTFNAFQTAYSGCKAHLPCCNHKEEPCLNHLVASSSKLPFGTKKPNIIKTSKSKRTKDDM